MKDPESRLPCLFETTPDGVVTQNADTGQAA